MVADFVADRPACYATTGYLAKEFDRQPMMDNLYGSVPATLPNELFQSLLETQSFRVERIVSHGHASPPGFWYDQEQAELVVLLKGAARLEFADQDAPVELKPGDFLNIPAHRRHRVKWTTPAEPTIWLAIHYQDSSTG